MLGDMSMQAHTMSLDEALERAQRSGPGSTVEVVDRAGRRTTYEIVTQPPRTAPRPVTLDSAEGRALLAARPGDALTIREENGRPRRVSVIAVTAAPASREDDVRPA
jgi:transcription elongation GreA/GreB family factor